MHRHLIRVIAIAAALIMVVTASALAAPSVRKTLKSWWEPSPKKPVAVLEAWHRNDQKDQEVLEHADDLYEPPIVPLPRGGAHHGLSSGDSLPNEARASLRSKRKLPRSVRRRPSPKRLRSRPPPNRGALPVEGAETDPKASSRTTPEIRVTEIDAQITQRDADEDSFPPPPPPPPPPVQSFQERPRRGKEPVKKPPATEPPKSSRPKEVPLGF